MIALDRQKYILECLQKKESVTRSELVEKLGVTAMTIGRDLKQMEEKGLLLRARGGATLPNYLVEETLYEKKKTRNLEAKQHIAMEATKMIHDGMTVLLDAGTTTFAIAEALKKKTFSHLTVITGDLRIGTYLYTNHGIHVILLGGEILPETGASSGTFAAQQIKNYIINLAFIGTSALTEHWEVVVPTESKATYKRAVIKSSEKAILVTDRSKFGERKLYRAAELKDFYRIITDIGFDESGLSVLSWSEKILHVD